ncbi:MAG: 1-acyl-sn-glycerol-3-phosphate acyltransferase [Desulfobacterales bacterium]|nr:1-acyl-sn-glycerol-3-phosphate acyltransferase [Desulfobacterales bacterium]
MIRTIFVWSCIVIALLVLGIVIFITYPFDRRGKVIHHYGRLWGKIALLVNRVKVRVEGIEHLKGEGPYIFMSNHQGTYDIFALLGHLPFQFRWLAKKELFSIPFFGWVMAAAGYVSVDREGTRKTVEAMNEAAQKIREGMSVVIFPEGSRSPDGSIQPFKKGGFTLAIKSKVPIIPISIIGSREIMPKGKLTVTSGEIRIRIDHPIETQNYSLKDRKSLMEKVRQTISKNFKLISGKLSKEET